MQTLSHERYLAMKENAEVLEADAFGEKVLRLDDGRFLKLFRRKRLISSALLKPYAKRFVDNATLLADADIPCPTPLEIYRIPSISRDAVLYVPLPGLTLRQLRQTPDKCPPDVFGSLGRFVADLHEKGIYFRSLHLGNVVLTPDGRLGLIDISDLRHSRRPLSNFARRRNFEHLIRDHADRHWLVSGIHGRFVEAYAQQSGRQELSASLLRNLTQAAQSA